MRSCFRATVHLSEHNVALTQMALSGHLSQQTVQMFYVNAVFVNVICKNYFTIHGTLPPVMFFCDAYLTFTI